MDERQTLVQARKAMRQGDKATAQTLLYQVIRANPRSEMAWLWLSAIVDNPVKECDCLKRVLKINPANETAQRHLAKLSQPEVPSQPQPTSQPTPLAACPSCGNPVAESAGFCSICGQALRASVPSQAPEAPPPTPEPQVAVSPKTPPKKKRKSSIILWLLVAVAVALFACCVIAGLGSIGREGGSAVPGSGSLTVEYRISGTAKGADLTFANSDGGTEQYSPMPVPYTIKLVRPRYGQFVYISAQNRGESGSITCEIVVNGKVRKRSTSAGPYTIATCSGIVGE